PLVDDGVRVLEVTAAHLIGDVDVDDVFFEHLGGLAPGTVTASGCGSGTSSHARHCAASGRHLCGTQAVALWKPEQPRSRGRQAAVDEDHLAGDVVAGAAGQEDRNPLAILWLTVAADHG